MNLIEYENLAKLNAPFLSELEEAFSRTLKQGWYILGQEVEAFEKEFAIFCGSQWCIGVSNGLDALELCLKILELPPNSEILVPSNTYIATILAILQAGLKPILVEPDLATYNIDPEQIRPKIGPKTKALMVVHLYGKLCDMNSILSVAKEHNLFVVEDCAQAHGASYQGKSAGTWGHLAAWSFYPTKNLGALGDGGAITTDNPDFAQKLRMMRNYGSNMKYYNDIIGRNARLDEIQAAFLRVKLKHLSKITRHKQVLAALYRQELQDTAYILPVIQQGYDDVFHIFPIRHQKRDQLRQFLLDQGIKTEVHYPVPPHKQKAMQGLLKGHYPLSELIHETILSLPISFFHTQKDILLICEALKKFL